MISQTTYGSDQLMFKINSKSKLLRDKRNGLNLNSTIALDYTFDLVSFIADEDMASAGGNAGLAIDAA